MSFGFWPMGFCEIKKLSNESSRLCPFGHRTGDFIEVGDTPFGPIADQ
jgi:hypothetical protein